MKKLCKRMISVLLVFSLILTTSVSTLALDGEEYICELRLVYAEDSDDARDILDDGEFYEYELLEEDLNAGTGEIGVFLAYKTTEDIEDAITDITVMQMDGGYKEGNYQEMIKDSYEEYMELGKSYKDAIEYFAKAYDADYYLAKAARRQLNFFSITDDEMDYDGDLLGDLFYAGVSKNELATIFMEGNSYALQNIRSLISMGVGYNADGKHYLQKVTEEATKMEKNPLNYGNANMEVYAGTIAASIVTFREMFEELATVENEMNFYDDNLTELEIQYAEHKSFADRLREVDYLGGKTLYEFCMGYTLNPKDLSQLYPLAAALNEGQMAMTRVSHYYDVVRYSMSDFPEEAMNAKMDELEKIYSVEPFDIFTGVDRSIYDGTFALTTEAYRNDANTEGGVLSYLFNSKNGYDSYINIGLGSAGICISLWAVCRTYAAVKAGVRNAAEISYMAYEAPANLTAGMTSSTNLTDMLGNVPLGNLMDGAYTDFTTCADFIDDLFAYVCPTRNASLYSFDSKVQMLINADKSIAGLDYVPGDGEFFVDAGGNHINPLTAQESEVLYNINQNMNDNFTDIFNQSITDSQVREAQYLSSALPGKIFTGALYLVGGILMIYSAIKLGQAIHSYHNPEYSDIPTVLVDVINTKDGDRYIKYDAVFEAEARDGEEYVPGDTNGFAGERWNALYYTKSYEAGKPLLANFELSDNNNVPDDGFAPVRRFGEVICYDLNRYAFDLVKDTIYLSVEQSENQKYAVAYVPELVGSIFSAGWALLAGGVGLLAGIGGTIGTQKLFKKKKQSASNTSEA